MRIETTVMAAVMLGAISVTRTALAQSQSTGPVISSLGDSASFSGYIAWGELVTILGTNLSDGGTYQAAPGPLPTQLGTTQVFSTTATCDISGLCTLVSLGEPLELLDVSPTRIDLVMSTSSPPQNCQNVGGQCIDLAVSVGGVTSPVWDIGYALYAPALFSSGFDCPFLGWPNAGAINVPCGLSGTQQPGQFPRPVVTDGNNSLVTNGNPARLGQPYALSLTGLGNPGYAGDLRSQFPTLRLVLSRCCLPAYFGGLNGDANVISAFAVGGSPGQYQMNFTLPSLSKSSLGSGTNCGSDLNIEVWLSVIANSVSPSGGGTGSNSLSIPLFVSADENPCGTITNITSSVNPSALGQLVTFTATVTPSAATGTVTFLDGTTVLGSGTLSGGAVTFSSSTLAAGTHSITASYSGDGNYQASLGTRTQTVKINTTVMLTASPNPSTFGQPLIFTATVVPSSATGTVAFFDGSSTLGVATLSSGTAMCGVSSSCSTSGLGPGSHTIKAVYNGDGNDGSSSATWTQIVTGNTMTTLTSAPNPSVVGQAVTFTASVSPCCILTGTVTFFDGSSALGTATLAPAQSPAPSQATFGVSNLAAGSHSIAATYGGDSNDNGSTSASLTQVVRPSAAITIASSPNPSIVGQSVNFTATVSPSTATGTVTFLDGSRALITNLPLSGGKTTFSVPNLSIGAHSITAAYSGDSNYGGSTSSVLTQTVNTH